MQAHIFFDTAQFERLRNLLSPDLFNKARVGALRRVAGNMRKNIRAGMRAASYLAGKDLTSAIGKLKAQAGGVEYSITVAGKKKAAHKFRMTPNRITARKGQRSVNWQSPGVAIGPGEDIRKPSESGFSKPFIAKTKKLRAMYIREKGTSELYFPKIVSPQYFAAFDRVKYPVLEEAEQTFMKRLEHEIDYRLGLGR